MIHCQYFCSTVKTRWLDILSNNIIHLKLIYLIVNMRSKLKTTVLQIIIKLHQLLLNTVQHSGFHCTPNWTELVDDDRTRFSPAEFAHVRSLARKVKSFLTRRRLSGWSWTRIIAPRIAIHHAAAARGRERKSGARKTKKRTERRTLKTTRNE